jgi:hypothetical protein
VNLVTGRLEGVPVRLGGGTIWLEREQDGQYRAAGKIELLFQGKALEGVEDVVATVLEVLGKEGTDGRSRSCISGSVISFFLSLGSRQSRYRRDRYRGSWHERSRIGRVRDAYNFLRDFFRGQNKIDTPACYGTRRHIWRPGCAELLRDSNSAHLFYAAQRCGPIRIIPRDNDRDQFAVPVSG